MRHSAGSTWEPAILHRAHSMRSDMTMA